MWKNYKKHLKKKCLIGITKIRITLTSLSLCKSESMTHNVNANSCSLEYIL